MNTELDETIYTRVGRILRLYAAIADRRQKREVRRVLYADGIDVDELRDVTCDAIVSVAGSRRVDRLREILGDFPGGPVLEGVDQLTEAARAQVCAGWWREVQTKKERGLLRRIISPRY